MLVKLTAGKRSTMKMVERYWNEFTVAFVDGRYHVILKLLNYGSFSLFLIEVLSRFRRGVGVGAAPSGYPGRGLYLELGGGERDLSPPSDNVMFDNQCYATTPSSSNGNSDQEPCQRRDPRDPRQLHHAVSFRNLLLAWLWTLFKSISIVYCFFWLRGVGWFV